MLSGVGPDREPAFDAAPVEVTGAFFTADGNAPRRLV